ncbi:MAG: bifunctional serine/threonine-protein kinase/formylglycine-generating enzyme family protein [Planctomycetota bacterium]
MNVERWERVQAVFHRLRELPAVEARTLLVELCGDELALRNEVASLLRAHEAAGAEQGQAPVFPTAIGRYRVLEVLGEGGMGVVYLAEQSEPLRRRVAVKVIKLGMDTAQVLARFGAERQALALMDHPNIARVYDAGSTDDGRPYFVMEHVPGEPITTYCDTYKLGVAGRLELVLQVCAGIQHAHHKGVVHRDLTPRNILVTVHEGQARPKIIDFGLARATAPGGHHSVYTRRDEVLGTPLYMSPEQAGLGAQDVDTRSDVYTLGVLLYELLVGDLPFAHCELLSAGLLEVQRAIRELDPPRPSSRLSAGLLDAASLAAARGTDPATLLRRLRGDLDWVVMKALEKDRTRRYQTAAELSADLLRFLDHEPVLASPPSSVYRLRKFVRRHRTQVVATVLVAVALLAGTFTSVAFAVSAARSAKLAENRGLQLAERQQRFDVLAHVIHLEVAKQDEAALYPAEPERAEAMRRWLAGDAARLRAALPEVRRTRHELDAAAPAEGSPDHFLRQRLARLERDLVAFVNDRVASVQRRLDWAEGVRAWTVIRHRAAWAGARDAIAAADGTQASARYARAPIDLEPQLGLVPIGMNPVTGLWEFYHLRSAWTPGAGIDPVRIPVPTVSDYEADGRLDVDEHTGIIFALIPGGAFMMGAQSADRGAPNYDRAADALKEEPVHRVTLRPFFLARHELTQAQWRRLTTEPNPSRYFAGREIRGVEQIGWDHPVESVSWADADRLLGRHGLTLPTEARWEYAVRGGTTTPWWTGIRPRSVLLQSNLLDRTAIELGGGVASHAQHEDGFAVHAPVDVLPCNPFGLHHAHGNVWEWCADAYGGYDRPVRGGDGLRLVEDPTRLMRGGAFTSEVGWARAAFRNHGEAERGVDLDVGVRAARELR